MAAAAVYGARRGGIRIDERVARRVADLLATDDPEQLRRALTGIAKSETLVAGGGLPSDVQERLERLEKAAKARKPHA
jgi:hypothetical protein